LIDLPGVGENLIHQTYTLIDFVAKKHVKTLGAPLPPLVDLPLFNPASAYNINTTFAQQQIVLYAETKTGILTYVTAATGSVPLQSILTKEEIVRRGSVFRSKDYD